MSRCRRCRATLLLALYLSCNVALGYRKNATLTPLNTYVDGAAVTVLHDTDISSNSWQIESSGSTGAWAMGISLDPSWGFHASRASNISLRVNSDTPTNGDDLDPILAFSVNSAQYWSTMLSADESTKTNRIGPQCDVNRPPLSTSRFYSGDVDAQVETETETREEASGAYPGKNWQPVQSVVYFPLLITIENIPGDGVTYVSHSNDLFTQRCGFAEAFATESGLQIFLHVDDRREFWSVQSFVVEYSYDDGDEDTEDTIATTTPTTWYHLYAIIGAAVFVCMVCVICVLAYKLYQKNRLERQVSDVTVGQVEPEPGQGRHDDNDDDDDDDDDDLAELPLEGSPLPARVFQPEGEQPEGVELNQHEESEESEEKSDSELLYNKRPIARAHATRMGSMYKTPISAGQPTRHESVDGDIVTSPAAGMDPNVGVNEWHNTDHLL